jgi:hypothetical protein
LEPITGGRAQITLGAIAQEDQLAEAHGLVAAFATEPLPTPWELAEVR